MPKLRFVFYFGFFIFLLFLLLPQPQRLRTKSFDICVMYPPARAVDNPGKCFLLLPLLLLLTRFSIYFVWLLYVVVSIFFSEFSFVQFYFFAAASLSENFINCFASTCGLKSPSQHHNPYIPTHTHTHNTP